VARSLALSCIGSNGPRFSCAQQVPRIDWSELLGASCNRLLGGVPPGRLVPLTGSQFAADFPLDSSHGVVLETI